jgi:hypothetical protein
MLGSSGATISVHPIVSLKPKLRAVAILTIILPQNQSKRSSSGASIEDLTFYLTLITESSIKSGWFFYICNHNKKIK